MSVRFRDRIAPIFSVTIEAMIEMVPYEKNTNSKNLVQSVVKERPELRLSRIKPCTLRDTLKDDNATTSRPCSSCAPIPTAESAEDSRSTCVGL